MRALRVLGIVGASLAGIVFLAIAVLWAASVWQPGRLARLVSAAVSSPGTEIAIGRIGFDLPLGVTLSEVAIRDDAGPWLTADRISAQLRLLPLLHGVIALHDVVSDRITVLRPPQENPNAAPESSASSLPAFRIDALDLQRLVLEPPVTGEAVDLRIEGKAVAYTAELKSGEFHVTRNDGRPGHADLAVQLAADSEARLELAARIDDPSGLVSDRLFQRKDHAPFRLKLDGAGPLDGWQGQLAATSGDIARIAARLSVRRDEAAYDVTAEGRAEAASLFPPQFGTILGEAIPFSVVSEIKPEGPVRLGRLDLGLAAGKLAAEGRFDPASQAVDAKLHLDMPDLGPLSPLFGSPLGGKAEADLALAGTVRQPEAKLRFELSDPRLAGAAAGRIAGRFDVTVPKPLSDAGARIVLFGRAEADRLSGPALPLPSSLAGAVELTVSASSDPAFRTITIDSVRLQDAGIGVDAEARLADAQATGTARLAVADLSPFSALAGRPLTGSGRAEATFDIDTVSMAGGAHLTGSILDLGLGEPTLQALLGHRLDLSATMRRTADSSLILDSADIGGSAAKLIATGHLAGGTAKAPVAATLTLAVPSLAPLGESLGRSVSGAASLAAEIKGTREAPVLQAMLRVNGLRADERKLDRLEAKLDLAGFPGTPSGRLAMTFGPGVLDGSAEANFTLKETSRLSIPQLSLAANGTVLRGKLDIDARNLLAAGRLTGRAARLDPWSQLAGETMSGQIDFDVNLGVLRGQTLDLKLTGSGLAAGTENRSRIAIETVSLRGQFADLLRAPSGRAELSLGGVALPGGRIARVRASLASIEPRRFRFETELVGTYREPVTLALAGEGALLDQGQRVTLARLAGTFGKDRIALARPLTLERRTGSGPPGVSFSGLDLDIGHGMVKGEGSISGDQLQLRLATHALPLGLGARVAGHPEIGGEIDGDLDFRGRAAQPEGRIVLWARDLRFAAGSGAESVPLALTARGDLHAGLLQTYGSLTGPNAAVIRYSASLPLAVDPASLAVALPETGRIAGRLDGTVRFADVQSLLPIGDDTIAGTIQIGLGIAGTVRSPELGGNLRIADGSYTNFAAGTTLKAIDLELVGNNRQLDLQRFSATDGSRGRITATGRVDLADLADPGLAMTATLSRFRFVARDDAEGTATGTVTMAGSLAAPRLEARLTVDRANIQIPDKLPPQLQALDVVQINSKTGQILSAPKSTETKPALAAELAMNVDMPGQIFVRGRGLDSEWRGRLAISGTTTEPRITGAMQAVRGSYEFLGKTFTITEGTIRFSGGKTIDPLLDVTAQVSSGSITALVKVGGTVSAPTVTLTSQPQLPQDEILAQVLFGQGLNQLSPAEGLQIAQMAASLAGGGGPDILQRVRKGLGLDVLRIGAPGSPTAAAGGTTGLLNPTGQTGASSSTSSGPLGNTAVSAGKYVARGVYVGVRQGFSTDSSTATVQIDLTPHLTLQTDIGNAQTGAGIGLNWKFDY
jgi:translocation and assembly module TamB